MRTQIWNHLFNVKFKALYTNSCSRFADCWGRIYSFVLAFISASSVGVWALWKQHPEIWAIVIGSSQVLQIARPYIPLIKNDKEFLRTSFEFERLYLEYEKLWKALDNDQIAETAAWNVFYKLREKELKIEQDHKEVHCPRFRRRMEKACKETEKSLSLDFS